MLVPGWGGDQPPGAGGLCPGGQDGLAFACGGPLVPEGRAGGRLAQPRWEGEAGSQAGRSPEVPGTGAGPFPDLCHCLPHRQGAGHGGPAAAGGRFPRRRRCPSCSSAPALSTSSWRTCVCLCVCVSLRVSCCVARWQRAHRGVEAEDPPVSRF